MAGRPKLVWVVTVRTQEAFGCHIYGLYATESVGKAAHAHVEAELATMNQWPIEKVKSEHWVSLHSYPLLAVPRLGAQPRRVGWHRPRMLEVTP